MTLILTAKDTQFKLSNSGDILFQPLINNPMPGEAVASVHKGETALNPVIQLKDGQDKTIKPIIEGWLARHIATVLGPLKNLKITGQNLPAPVQAICDKLYNDMGVIHRELISDAIADLSVETRQPLRDKKIKMGPILVFLPELNKPAAVRLKAVLWSAYNDAPLPPPTPNDGVVSVTIDPETVNRDFFRIIGYPVFGPRAIRIDMLDRVINAIYDTAKDGKFQAEHKMAEWLGCSIDDLYAVIRAMGHKQIKSDPVLDTVETVEAVEAVEKNETTETENTPKAETEQTKQNPDVKPDLDWFWIKKGKASEKPKRKTDHKKKDEKPVRNAKKKAKVHSKKGKDEPKVFSFGADDKDNPFAALQALKK